ncbi:hypothetical protein TNCV_1096411 [Trichonephila clavipes]|nr:hypothetical protein TNCV_1096411 [Trichonephila clavipes]
MVSSDKSLMDVNAMVQQLPSQLDDDHSSNVNKKNMIHKSTYRSGVVKKSEQLWSSKAIGDDPIEHIRCGISAPEALLARQHSILWKEELVLALLLSSIQHLVWCGS